MESSIKQLKLVNGEEVICEIISEAPDSFAVRNAYKLVEKVTQDGFKFYTFRTFMVYQDTPLSVMLVMADKIMGMAIPTKEMLEQYEIAKLEMFELKESEQADDEYYNTEEYDPEFADQLDEYINECDVISLFDSDVSDMKKH